MKFLITTMLLLCSLASKSFAQEIKTFTIQQNNQPVVVTQDIDNDFLGTYAKQDGKRKWEYGLYSNKNSFFFKQTLSDPFNKEYDWDNTKKQKIKWGVLVEDGKIAKRTVSEFKDGKIQNFEAMILIYQTETDNKTYDVLLYQKDGKFHLESTVKTSTVASIE